MFHHIKGLITHINDHDIVVEVAGIGFSILVPQPGLLKGSIADLQLYMHWNQEQGPSLYGFQELLEKKVFLLIISCSGIGPKIGISVLSQMTASAFIKAVSSHDLKALSSVSGIGAKKAEQLMVHLKHKINDLIDSGIQIHENVRLNGWKDLSDALNSLNYSRPEISKTMHYLRSSILAKKWHLMSF